MLINVLSKKTWKKRNKHEAKKPVGLPESDFLAGSFNSFVVSIGLLFVLVVENASTNNYFF